MLYEDYFYIINIYSINGFNWISELLWHQLLQEWCKSDKSDVDSANF